MEDKYHIYHADHILTEEISSKLKLNCNLNIFKGFSPINRLKTA